MVVQRLPWYDAVSTVDDLVTSPEFVRSLVKVALGEHASWKELSESLLVRMMAQNDSTSGDQHADPYSSMQKDANGHQQCREEHDSMSNWLADLQWIERFQSRCRNRRICLAFASESYHTSTGKSGPTWIEQPLFALGPPQAHEGDVIYESGHFYWAVRHFGPSQEAHGNRTDCQFLGDCYVTEDSAVLEPRPRAQGTHFYFV
jgi:hypothetical protein